MVDSIEFVVVDGNDQWCFCVLTQDVRLFQTDGQSEVLAYLGDGSEMARLKSLPSDRVRK